LIMTVTIPAPDDDLSYAPPASLIESRLAQIILAQLATQGLQRTMSPQDAARAMGGPHPDGWGPLMPSVRRAAIQLAQAGRIVILRKGRVVDPLDFRGVYRLALSPFFRER
jgi:Protein of unknown function (DUF3253)